jgi:type I restriction enzyme S subunit
MAKLSSENPSIERSDLPELPESWLWVKFADTCERVSVGHVGPTTEFFTNNECGVRFIRSQNVRPGKLEQESAVSITPEFHKKLKKSQLRSDDILFVRVGANRGDCCVVPKGIGELNCANIVFARPMNPTGFHAYFFQSDLGRNLLLSASVGAAQGVINTGSVAAMPVPLPPLPVQQRIAGILSAYDELIENNQRRIRILEEMARSLYREWFVHFRYPGHENVPLVASPLGEIPQGWEVKTVAEVAAVNRAQINARTAPEELHYIDISSVSPGQIDSITTYAFNDAPGRARRVIQHGDTLWSCVRPNRRSHVQVMHPEENTIASTGFAVLTATKVPFTFLYLATTTDDFVTYLTNNATGAAYPAVTASTFEKADLLIPPSPLLKEFGNATISMAEQIHTLQRQIQNLRRTRDLLLPRLLSGQIDVEAIAS